MSIVGIDQSLTGTGLVEIGMDGKIIRNSIIRTKKLLGVERLNFIVSEIDKFLSEIKVPFLAVREGYSYGYAKSPFAKSSSIFELGELGGCIDLCIYRCQNIFLKGYYTVPPTVMKKFCLGEGGSKKDTSYLLTVFNKLNIQFEDDNQADAFMLAKTVLAFAKICDLSTQEASERSVKFFESLSLIEKEAILSSLLSKKGSGVTKATIKKMDHLAFAGFATSSSKEYSVFFRR